MFCTKTSACQTFESRSIIGQPTLREQPDYEWHRIPSICRRIWFTAHNGPRSKRTQRALCYLHISVFSTSMVSLSSLYLVHITIDSDIPEGPNFLFLWAPEPSQQMPKWLWPWDNQQAYPSESSDPIGVIVCKQSMHRHLANRGYIAMLSVSKDWRKRGIGSVVRGFDFNC
jgi:hypothetical protein